MTEEEKFEEIYVKLKNDYGEELRKEKLKAERENKENFHTIFNALKIVAILEICMLIFCKIYKIDFFESNAVGYISLLIFIFAGYITWNKLNFNSGLTYKISFKSKIMSNLIKSFDENFEYLPLLGISEKEYQKVAFENYDIYSSRDAVQYNFENKKLIMSYILTQNKHTDSEGGTSYYKVFGGMFVEINLEKSTDFKMYIKKDLNEKNFIEKQNIKKYPFRKMRIDLDSSEFEEVFDVYSSNEMIAMQILTADIMELFVDLQKKMNNTFEITIKDNNIYIKFGSENIFDMNIGEKSALDKEALFEKYKNMEYIFSSIKKINEIIERVL